MTQSLETHKKPLKRYKTIDPNSGQIAVLNLDPTEQAHSNVIVTGVISMLLANASGQESLTKTQTNMLMIGMQANKVTIDEAMMSFWKAYGDPYVSGGRIEFRHMMKYITEERERNNVKYYSYAQVLDLVAQGKHAMSDFLCLNGEDGKMDIRGSNGKPLWALYIELNKPG